MFWCIQKKIDNRGTSLIDIIASVTILLIISTSYLAVCNTSNKIQQSVEWQQKQNRAMVTFSDLVVNYDVKNIIDNHGNFEDILNVVSEEMLQLDLFDYSIILMKQNYDLIHSISTTNISDRQIKEWMQNSYFQPVNTNNINPNLILLNVTNKNNDSNGIIYVAYY
ncbi:MAG: hypothetical protein BEN19_02700 [Epulopiscium sp. Nuni2H_MBin003]|nr:MAG: hypothetical protein BEN19_02700 [Epulopiscium sp. Nuni2H_MBin003]